MASDDTNKSSNLKVPPLRIVINNNNSVTSGTNGNTGIAANNFSGANINATDLNTVTSASNQNVVPGSNISTITNSTITKFKASTSNLSNLATEVKTTNSTGASNSGVHQIHSRIKSDEGIVKPNLSLKSSSAPNRNLAKSESTCKENEKTPLIKNSVSNQEQTSSSHLDAPQVTNDNHKDVNNIISTSLYSAIANSSTSSSNLASTSSDSQLDINNDCSANKDPSSSLSTNQRITRSSQRAAQQNRSDIQTDHPMTSADDQNSNSENIDRGNEQGRKTKKRKGESPENDQDSSASTTSSSNTNQQPSLYQPSAQNSFQLYKNIRNQVDKRIKSLNCVHPKTPHGFKDYLLNRGVYLLNGNKLGNGSLATTNKNNEILTRGNAPLLNNNVHLRIQLSSHYVVPEQVAAPLSLAISSPLHQLFVEQEKSRHKMRMHHIMEREKLTLSAEQEILRVYNQAALAAANQLEPFSVCTLLKHQEIYNYIEPDEPPQADLQQAQAVTDGENPDNLESVEASVETKKDCAEKSNKDSDGPSNKEPIPMDATSSVTELKQEPRENTSDISMEFDQSANPGESTNSLIADHGLVPTTVPASSVDSAIPAVAVPVEDPKTKKKEEPEEKKPTNLDCLTKEESSKEVAEIAPDSKAHPEIKKEPQDSPSDGKLESNAESSDIDVDKPCVTASSVPSSSPLSDGGASKQAAAAPTNVISDDQLNNTEATSSTSTSAGLLKPSDTTNQSASNFDAGDDGVKSTQEEPMIADEEELSDDARSLYNKKIFFGRLQDIDDKWERIKCEMLIRHKNEAESLYAVQKLEWEWKAKEIGVCDVRTTPTIEQIYVPKVDVVSLDY